MVERISFLGKEWTIDNKDLVFTDATLNQFFEKIGGIIDYVGAAHANSMRYSSACELAYKKTFIEKFKLQKMLENLIKQQNYMLKVNKNALMLKKYALLLSIIKIDYMHIFKH